MRLASNQRHREHHGGTGDGFARGAARKHRDVLPAVYDAQDRPGSSGAGLSDCRCTGTFRDNATDFEGGLAVFIVSSPETGGRSGVRLFSHSREPHDPVPPRRVGAGGGVERLHERSPAFKFKLAQHAYHNAIEPPKAHIRCAPFASNHAAKGVVDVRFPVGEIRFVRA